jgi:hypothetical protein
MRLGVKQFSLAAGLVWGVAILLVTLVAAARGIGNQLSHLSAIFPGYEVSYVGSAIGLVYGFVSGAIAGFVFVEMYNAALPEKT